MTPQLVDHAHTDSYIVIGCSLAENEHVYFWSQSHHGHKKYVNNALYTTSRDSTGVALAIGRVV